MKKKILNLKNKNKTKMVNEKKFIFHSDETAKIYLEDDKTETGGTAFANETLENFMLETKLPTDKTNLKTINKALKECGIKQLKVEEKKGEVGSCITINKDTTLIRKDFDTNSDRFYYKSKKNFEKNEELPCYSTEDCEIDEYYTKKDLLEIACGNYQTAEKMINQMTGLSPLNQYEQWKAEDEID